MIKLLSKHSKVTLAVVSALAGAILGAVVQNVLRSSFSLLATVALLLCLLVFALLAKELEMEDSRRQTDKQIITNTESIANNVKLSHADHGAELSAMSSVLIDRMAALSAQFGLRVERLLQSEVNSYSLPGEDTSAKMILGAKEELRILDIVAEDGSWPDEVMKQDLLGGVFGQIIARVKDPKSRISYRRIIQVADVSTALRNTSNQTLISHCEDMLKLREERNRASLKIAKRRFPFKLVLIDDSGLIIQLQEYGNNGAFGLWGELQISDPSHNLVSIFKEIWDQVDAADGTRTLTHADLPTGDITSL